MKRQFIFFSLLLLFFASCAKPDKGHYTLIVSLDGFRWDYPSMYHTPNLNKIAVEGVSATMLPSFPASTFPNHYTLATGLVPDHNGIINNTFWDVKNQRQYSMADSVTRNNPDYYLGEPIWITAQKQGLKTGNLYWVGSDIPIRGVYPTYYKAWKDVPRLDFAQRVDTAVSWLSKPEEERPRLIMMYMEEPDGVGHNFGPVSEETGTTVHRLDSLMGVLVHKVSLLPIVDRVNIIVTSDHGMTGISEDRIIYMDSLLKPEWIDKIDGTTPTSIFTKAGYRDSVYNALKDVGHIRAWKKEEIPAELNYGSNERIGDIVVAPEIGWQFTDKARESKGAHGYFPREADMQVIFRAFGPDFKRGYTSKGFVNVDIYPLLAHLLDIKPENTDGQIDRVKDMLK